VNLEGCQKVQARSFLPHQPGKRKNCSDDEAGRIFIYLLIRLNDFYEKQLLTFSSHQHSNSLRSIASMAASMQTVAALLQSTSDPRLHKDG